MWTLATRSGLVIFAAIAIGVEVRPALGQGNQFNPYGNSGYADYREFTTPMYGNNPSLPGQARLQSETLRGSNRFNQLDSYFDDEVTPGRNVSRPGVPYFRAFRQYDEQFNRVYKPNDTEQDREFRARQKARTAAYAKALEERDPKKKAALMKKLDQDSLKEMAIQSRSARSRQPSNAASRAEGLPSVSRSEGTREKNGNEAKKPGTTNKPAASSSSSTKPAQVGPKKPADVTPPASTNPATVPVPAPN